MKKRMLRVTGIVMGVALLVIMSGPNPSRLQAAAEDVCDANGKLANLDFILKDINGKEVSLSAYKGKVILLDFWATWCAPCKIEIPGQGNSP